MTIIDADKFLSYLIFSKHIDGLTCGEVKEAIEMCKVDMFDKIREEINGLIKYYPYPVVSPYQTNNYAMLIEDEVLQIIDKYREGEDE